MKREPISIKTRGVLRMPDGDHWRYWVFQPRGFMGLLDIRKLLFCFKKNHWKRDAVE